MTSAGPDLDGADLRDVDWRGQALAGRYTRCDLSGADLSGATGGAVFEECAFDRAVLDGAVLEGAAFLRCRFGAVSARGAVFRDCKAVGSEWTRKCRLERVVVEGGDWSFVALRQQDLSSWRLDDVRLVEADLAGADLRGARVTGCDLTGAVLREARLTGSAWRDCRLAGVVVAAEDLIGLGADLAAAVDLALALGVRLLDEP